MRWTRPLRPFLSAGEKLIDRALCVTGAILFSQLPEFFQQYLQRLGGHLDEARRQLDQFRQTAAQSGMTLDRLIADASGQADPAMARLGHVVADTAQRVDTLAASESALREASAWSRPFVFLRHFDPAIAHATWAVFRPAVPTTAEGLVYAALGMAAMLALYHGLVRGPLQRACAPRSAVQEGV
jgi:hypothetical protein